MKQARVSRAQSIQACTLHCLSSKMAVNDVMCNLLLNEKKTPYQDHKMTCCQACSTRPTAHLSFEKRKYKTKLNERVLTGMIVVFGYKSHSISRQLSDKPYSSVAIVVSRMGLDRVVSYSCTLLSKNLPGWGDVQNHLECGSTAPPVKYFHYTQCRRHCKCMRLESPPSYD